MALATFPMTTVTARRKSAEAPAKPARKPAAPVVARVTPARPASARSIQIRRAYVAHFRERPRAGMTPRMALAEMAEFLGTDGAEALAATMPSDPKHWLEMSTRNLIATHDAEAAGDDRRAMWEEIRRRAIYDGDGWAKHRTTFACCGCETCNCGDQ